MSTEDPLAALSSDAADSVAEDLQLSEADQADLDEWDAATDELFPGLNSTDKEGEDGKTKSGEGAEKDGASQEDSANKESNAAKGTGDDAKAKSGSADENSDKSKGQGTDDDDGEGSEEDGQAEPTAAASRLSAREQEAAVAAVRDEVREKMFADVPTQLISGDGEVLDSPEKVMQFNNPATGEPFTRDEATLWLAAAERDLKNHVEAVNKQVEEITETNLTIKDEADVINWEFGELLRAMPELRDRLWAEYEKTLDRDTKSGVITKAKVSLRNFYTTALEPYAEMGRRLEAQNGGTSPPQKSTADAEAAKRAAEAEKQKRRQDRSDIYGGGKLDDATDDDKEWGAAAQAVFGDQLKR